MGYFLGCVLTKAAAALPFIIQSPPFRLAGKRAEEVCTLPGGEVDECRCVAVFGIVNSSRTTESFGNGALVL